MLDNLNNLMRKPFWVVVGEWITILQLRIIAAALGIPESQFVPRIGEHWLLLACLSYLNGCAVLFTVSGATLLLALHIAGAF